ncbi:MAG: RluA family pseudouridine synthase [Polyangiaceae bacterium]|nr:RluA family pseudouridine synthase [Polyangiaceae bacterium]
MTTTPTRPDARAAGSNELPWREQLRRGDVEVVRPTEVPADAIVKLLRVPPESAGMRLDRFVQTQLRATSRSRSQRIIARGAYTPAGARLHKNHRLKAEERVAMWRAPWDELTPDIPLAYLYEDAHLLAIDKPPFVAVHPTARHHRSTVVMLLEAQRPGEHLTLGHRIDRETSGVLLLAKTRAADRALKAMLEAKSNESLGGATRGALGPNGVVKRYLALAWGTPAWDELGCELPLEPDAGNPLRVKMRVAERGTGLPAVTWFETLGRRIDPTSGRRYALLRATLYTGRQHQIRVHLAALGLPIVGDKLYGPDERMLSRAADGALTADDLGALELDRHALHATALELDHPLTGERVTIGSPLPPDLATFWERLVPA